MKLCCFDGPEKEALLDNSGNQSVQLQKYGVDKSLNDEVTDYNSGSKISDPPQHQGKFDIGTCIIAHTYLTLIILTRTGATLSSQVATGKTNIAQLNSLRYGFQFVLAIGLILVKRTSITVERKYILPAIGLGCANVCAATCLYFTASLMPVGNLEATYLVLYVLFTTVLDFVKGDIQVPEILRSLLAIAGVILLSQPWSINKEPKALSTVPCDYWDKDISSNGTTSPINSQFYDQMNGAVNASFIYTNTALNLSVPKSSENITRVVEHNRFYTIFINGAEHQIAIHPFYLGCCMLVLAASLSSLKSYLAKFLAGQVEPVSLVFWLSILEGSISVLVTIIWSKADNVTVFSLPNGLYCLIFTFSFAVCTGLAYTLFVLTVSYFNISKIAVSYVVITVLLYICQRTWLKVFHPGHGNLMEVFGIVIILVSLLLSPLMEYVKA